MSTIFSHSADHLLNLRSQATTVNTPVFKGSWSSIEIQPDIFSPQKFIIGVAVQPINSRLHFKLLDEFKKFECVYGDKFSQSTIRELFNYAESTLRIAAQTKRPLSEIEFDTEHLSISVPKYTSGADSEVTVERLFSEIVSMAPHIRKKGREFESIDTNKVRILVNEELKRIAHLDFEKIVLPDTSGMLYDDTSNNSRHYLDFNLLTKSACGSVVSAVYKTAATIEINLLRTTRDLTTYSRIKKINDTGVFLLLPNKEHLEPKEYKHIDELIGEQSWKLERDGIRVVGLESHVELAKEVYSWALPSIG